MAAIWVVGTLDTKAEAIVYLADRIRETGRQVVVMDVSISGTPATVIPDVSAAEVAATVGDSIDDICGLDRGRAIASMMKGAARLLSDAHRQGRVAGVIAVGGSGGASIASAAMQALPIGVPKLLITTVASGDTRPFIGTADIALLHPVVDIMGMNSILERVLTNAAGAIVGMAQQARPVSRNRTVCGITAFGATTPCVDACRIRLEAEGFEVLVFHARGTGGQAMECLISRGEITAVLDLTTTELADEVAGGCMSAGPDRLNAAALAGIPQVVAPGALDIVNLGPPDRVPPAFKERRLYAHNPNSVLMRTSADEMRRIGALMADKLNRARGPVAVLIPMQGFSAYDRRGGVFFDPPANEQFMIALGSGLNPAIPVQRIAAHLNDEKFAAIAVERLLALLKE